MDGLERTAPRWWIALAAALAALLLLVGFGGLRADRGDGVVRSQLDVEGIPVTVLRPADPRPAPGLVVVHGFAGSASLMDGLATAWARAGFAVAVPDLPGHGGNPEALPDDRAALAAAVDAVADRLRTEPFVSGAPLQLVGHSMGAAAVVAAAVGDPRYGSTVALSLPSAQDIPTGEAGRPANLLLLWGSAEQQRFADAALAGLHAAYPAGEPGVRYGDPAAGTAREAREVPGSEHLSILWRTDTAQWTYDWLAGPAALPAAEVRLAPRIRDVAAVALGCLLAMVPLTALLYGNARPSVRPVAGPGRAVLLMVGAGLAASLGAAVAAGLGRALPLAVGGHLALWFAIAAVVLLLAAAGHGWRPAGLSVRAVASALALAALMAAGLAVSGRMAWAPFALVGPRVWLFALFALVFLAWFGGDDLMVRGPSRVRRGLLLVLSRLLVVGFLLGGVFVLQAPGFLLLLLPLMVPLLALLAAAAWIVAGRTADVLAPAAVQALPLALLVATTFPLLSG